jgi:sugar lactone lactonase YvrE
MGPPGPSFAEWSSTDIYSAGALVYTNTDPFGRDRFCAYYAVNQNSDKDPRENSASVANSAWAAIDDACQTGSAPPPPGAGYTLGGTLSGLAGATSVTLSLTVDGTVTTSILNTNGSFTLPRRVSLGSTYAVSITAQPVGGTCTTANSSGTVSGAVSNITVSCGVVSADIQRLEIYNNSPTAPIGYPRQFAVNGVAANGSRTDLTLAAVWSSSDSSIANVNTGNGQVTGIAVGTATISASYGGLSVGVDVSVISVPIVTTYAGSGRAGSADAAGQFADFNYPNSLAIDSNGLIYVTDMYNHTIRRINPTTAMVETVAGSPGSAGYVDGPGPEARFTYPTGLEFDSAGSLYVSDSTSVRKVTIAGGALTVTTLAGGGEGGYVDSPDGANNGSGVKFSSPVDIAIDRNGNLFVTDNANAVIRKILPSGVTSTFAGSGFRDYLDGIGKGARFNTPWKISKDSADNLYVSDVGNATIRKITPDGLVTSVPNTYGAVGVLISRNGALYFTNRCFFNFRELQTNTGSYIGRGCGYSNGAGGEVQWGDTPQDIAEDSTGNLYVTDPNNVIRKISPAP